MSIYELNQESRKRHPARSRQATAPQAVRQHGGRLRGLLKHVSVLAALGEPEAVVALANGVPNLDDDTLVQFLYDSRVAA